MKSSGIRTRLAATLVVSFSAFPIGLADAAEIRALIAAGLRPVMEELGPKFELATGHTLLMQFAPADAVTMRVRNGEAAHVVITPWEIETLAKDGKIAPESLMVVGRAGLGLAVRTGAARPDISSPDAFKRALLAATSITYLNPAQKGDSGYYFAKVLGRLDVTEAVTSKAVIPKTTAAIGGMIAGGEAEIAVLAIQHIIFISATGVELVGPLPPELQETMVFSAGIVAAAADRNASNALLAFLRGPEANTVMKAKGVEPATP